MIRIMMIKSVVSALVFCAAQLRSKYFMPSSFFIKFPAFKTLLYCHITTPELLLLSGHLESFSCFLGVVFLEGIGELGDLWPQSQSSPWPTSEAAGAGGFLWPPRWWEKGWVWIDLLSINICEIMQICYTFLVTSGISPWFNNEPSITLKLTWISDATPNLCQQSAQLIYTDSPLALFVKLAFQVSSLLRAQWSQLVERYVHHPQVATNCGRITSVGGCLFFLTRK